MKRGRMNRRDEIDPLYQEPIDHGRRIGLLHTRRAAPVSDDRADPHSARAKFVDECVARLKQRRVQ